MIQHKPEKIYVLSGLGVDHRVFAGIDFGTLEVVPISWLQPFPHEPLADYARRLSAQITEAFPIILGLSFGGIMAQEIARIIPCRKIILLASAQTKYELPGLYRFFGKLNLHKLVPGFFFKYSWALTEYFFGVSTTQEKKLLALILKETDPVFRSWAIHALLHWDRTQAIDNSIVVHGSKDKIIPISKVQADFTVRDAGHFMTVTHAGLLCELLKKIVKH